MEIKVPALNDAADPSGAGGRAMAQAPSSQRPNDQLEATGKAA